MLTDAVISLAGVAVSLVGAWLIARKYGDVAGTLAARRFQEEDAKRARVTAFQSLINALARIRGVVEHYQSPAFSVGRGVPKFPVTAFETAFVSGSPGLAASSELLDVVNNYLIAADSINSFIDICLTKGGDWSRQIKQACTPLPGILDRLEDCLQRELSTGPCNFVHC
jgi:hypothetical protein